MRLWSIRSLIAIGLSIAVGILLYTFVARSPYFLGIVLIGGVYLAGVSTMKAGAVYGAVISFALGLFFAVTNTLGPDVAKNGLGSLLIIALIAGFGAVYGAALVWVKQKLSGGTSFN